MALSQSAILKKLKSLKRGAKVLRGASTVQKNEVLFKIAEFLKSRESLLLKANKADLKKLKKATAPAFVDRLTLNSERIDHMCESLNEVAKLHDPIGELAEERTLDNGLRLKRVRAPLGVIFMIFESRPNVAIEAFSLAFKSGNVTILRGGKESMHTTAALYDILKMSLKQGGFDPDSFWGITDSDRKIPQFLLNQKDFIDVVVPRGGDGLIQYVVKNSLIPIIKNDRGLCHVYVHEDGDLDMAEQIIINAKTQRPGVCNSVETALVHESVASVLIPRLYESMEEFNVEWFVDPSTKKILSKALDLKTLKAIQTATAKSWNTEYLDFKINCRVVTSLDEALAHIETYGSKHSESIITETSAVAKKFQNEVDAAAVYWNASTRFTDGFEFGLGGELGISTQKLHVRGPVGLRELTNLRWIIEGSGQIRK